MKMELPTGQIQCLFKDSLFEIQSLRSVAWQTCVQSELGEQGWP
jgi:hypothetical protein